MMLELSPVHDSRKSFYGKAHVLQDEDGNHTLLSYRTTVAGISPSGPWVIPNKLSATSLRHVKEFFKQNDVRAETKSQIIEDYGL